MNLPLSITSDLDLDALKEVLAQIKETEQQSRKTCGAGIDDDMKNT